MRILVVLILFVICFNASLYAVRKPFRDRHSDESEATATESSTQSLQENTEKFKNLRSKSVSEFFEQISSSVTLETEGGSHTDQEIEVLNWLQKHVQSNLHKDSKFILTKTRLGSSDADILEKHIQKKYPLLKQDRDYIAVQYVRQSMSTEYHGVIEIKPLRLLSYWKELN